MISILNLEFQKAAVSGQYCFLSMLANFLRSLNHIFLIPIVMHDTQLFIAFRPGNDLEETAAITTMESCIADISQWMHSDKLKVNSYKTESLLIGTRHQLQKVPNSHIMKLPNSHIMKLQRIRNAAARLVTGTPRFCHVTPLLFHLHWLLTSDRIKFKILLLTFKCSKSNPGTL